MSFVVPAALGLLMLLPVLIVFYLLKVRRVEFEVSSTLLWDHLHSDMAAHEPWQRLRVNPLLLLQLLLMLVLVLAVARPFYLGLSTGADHVVIVLDASASMQSTDVTPSRFEAAKKAAQDLVDRLGDGTTVVVLAARSRPETVISATTNKHDVQTALAAVHPGSTTTNMRDTVVLALSLLKSQQHAEVDIVSDGAFGDLGPLGVAGTPIHLVTVGTRSENQGITAFNVRTNPQNRSQAEAFVRVRNYADGTGTNVLSLYGDGKLVASKEISAAGQAHTDTIFADLPMNVKVLEAKLQQRDDLALDNSAIAVLNQATATRVLLVSPGNIFLENVLRLLPIRLFRADPKNVNSLDAAGYDVLVFDGVLPPVIPNGNLLLINPPDSPLVHVEGMLGTGSVTALDKESPVLQYADISGLQILKAKALSAPNWTRTVAGMDGRPLILTGEQNNRKVAVIAFDLHDSNLPLQTSFPILMANLIGYVQPPADQGVEQSTAGGTVLIQPVVGATTITVRRPDQSVVTLKPDGPRAISFDQTDQIGLYVVTQRSATAEVGGQMFAVNLLDDAESNTRPSRTLTLAGSDAPESLPAPVVPTRREIWQLLALLVLGLLATEWWWYHRRA